MRVIALMMIAAALAGCAQPRRVAYSSPQNANAREDLIVRLPADRIAAFMSALRTQPIDVPGTNINVGEWRGDRLEAANAQVYDAALDDAQRKASAIASRIGTRLGSVLSVTEFRGAVSSLETVAVEKTLSASPVNVGSDRNVTLSVVYATPGGGTISVFGLGDALAHGAGEGIDVNIYVNGRSSAEVTQRLALAEAAIHRIGNGFHLTPQAFLVNNLGFGRS